VGVQSKQTPYIEPPVLFKPVYVMLVVERGKVIVKASPRVSVKEKFPEISEVVDFQPGAKARVAPETAVN